DYDAPGAVLVRLFVELRVEDRHMAAHLSAGELDEDDVTAGAATPEGDQLVPGAHVGNKVRPPENTLAAAGATAFHHFRFGVELLTLLAVEAAGVLVRVVEEQVRLGESRHRDREVVVVEDAHRPVAAGIAELMPAVTREAEETVLLKL